ncbi:MAG: hypothetical protein FD180_377 [Planctomycetota bacterium]|nr:MAG: hypothetical protein FD180_377 [Planctomycetota bacterium]
MNAESAVLRRKVGNRPGEATALEGRADLDLGAARWRSARKGFERAMALHRAVGHERRAALVAAKLADMNIQERRGRE